MERKNRLAIFEHVAHKERSNNRNDIKSLKRTLEPQFDDSTVHRNLKRRRKNNRTLQDDLTFTCGYDECDYNSNNYYDFLNHIENHVDGIEDLDSENFDCLWEDCDYLAENLKVLKRHALYHGYHSRLKIIGNKMLTKLKLPDCKMLHTTKIIYASSNRDVCEWENCSMSFLSFQAFIDHVKCHVNATPKRSVEPNDIKCGWAGCSSVFPIQCKLKEHIRSHTKERVIACPTCGFMFHSNTKFYDHRKRQLDIDLQSYQCSQCSKQFASERLLRDHMRVHINHYKCHLCDMTCPKPSILAKHIRYRHLPDRLFKCDICSHSTITKQDLVRHRETHTGDGRFECLWCDYKCRSEFTIQKHLAMHEGSWDNKYACHCCDKRFARGSYLTKHLIKVHDFHWPSGHSRFHYKQDTETGLYHLQVVRYESLEVTQEMMQGNLPYQFEAARNLKFKCEQTKDVSGLSYEFKVSNANDSELSDEENDNLKKNNNVLITIEEVDSKGNIIKFEAVEDAKIIYPSDIKRQDFKRIK